MQKNIPKGLLMITLTFLFTLTIAGAAFAATGDQVTNATVTPTTLPLVNSNSTQGGDDQFVVSTTPAQGFPTNGSSYANINTGNDWESYAKLTLNLTIPQGAKTLSFDWMYATNEASQAYFNDWARADITDGTSTQNILYADTYSNLVSASGLGYYHATPTQKAIIDVSPYAGRSIRLDFSVSDVGDTGVTSALFIDNVHIGPLADVSVVNDVDDNTPAIGQLIKYTIRAYNNLNSPNTATGVTVIDDLPDGVTFNHASSADYDSANDVWNVGTLLPGEMKILYIWATVNTHPTSTSYTNTAIISGNEGDWNLTNNNDSETIYVPQVDLKLNKYTNDGNNWNYHTTHTFYLNLTNSGNDNATGVVLSDTLPAGLEFVDASGAYSIVGNVITWTIGNLDAGASTLQNITVYVTGHNAIATNYATAASNEFELNSSDNTANATVTIPAAVDLQLSKYVKPGLGSVWNYNTTTGVFYIDLYNAGPDNATCVKVTDLLPACFAFDHVDVWPGMGTFDPSTMTWNIEDLAVDHWAYLDLYVNVTGHNTTATNYATAASNEFELNSTDNAANATVTIPAAADVVVAKEFRTNYQNSTSTTTTANYHTPIWAMVHATNAGPDAVEGLNVTDILPAGLTYLNEYFVSHDGGLTWTAEDVYNATTGVWNIGSLLNGADYWIAVLAQVDGHNTTITNVANKTQSTFDWNATNDNGNATLTVPAAADVYVNTSTSKNNPAVGEEVVVRVKAGNNGPDTAQNVIVTYKVPEGMEFVSLTQETGYPAPVYDPTTRTVTWNLGNLTVIDPWMDITLRAVSAGATSGDASVSSDTYDPVSGNNLESGAISVEQAQVNAATIDTTVPMQKTGVPIGMIVTALLMLVTGLVMPRRK